MSDHTPPNPPPTPDKTSESERTRQVSIFGWTAGICVFGACITLVNAPTWPVAFGVAVIAVVGAYVFITIFKRA